MKYLEINVFDQINDILSGTDAGDMKIYGKLEAYSCKTAGEDKKLYKTLESKYVEEMESESQELSGTSPFGPLAQQASRKTLYHLIAALNSSFPDYDFSNVKAEHFSKQSTAPLVINSINTSLSCLGDRSSDLTQKLWNAIDSEVSLAESDIYCFIPDVDSDPYGDEGSIWSFHYFFYNKKRKRIIFVTCRAVSLMGFHANDGGMSDADSDDMDMSFDEPISKRTISSGSWVTYDSLVQGTALPPSLRNAD